MTKKYSDFEGICLAVTKLFIKSKSVTICPSVPGDVLNAVACSLYHITHCVCSEELTLDIHHTPYYTHRPCTCEMW